MLTSFPVRVTEPDERLGLIAKIIGMSSVLAGDDPGKAVLWFRHQPIPAFDLRTAEELVESGHGDAVVRHLEMLSNGVYEWLPRPVAVEHGA